MSATATKKKTPKTTIKPIKRILISQPDPEKKNHPYSNIERKYGVKVSFRQFIQVEEIPSKQFRKARINPYDYSAIIFTSRQAIDHFFRVCEEMRTKMSMETKYFCVSESVALYLQKYIQYRKRKVSFGAGRIAGLKEIISKHKGKEKFLLPCAEVHSEALPNFLTEKGLDFDKAMIYKTVPSDLSDIDIHKDFDLVVFYSPSGVKSLIANFKSFKQKDLRIAGFGKATAAEVEKAKLNLDIAAPSPETPSMGMAIAKYLDVSNK